MSEKNIIQLERKLDAKIKKIGNKTLTPKESNISVLFRLLNEVDEVSYTKYMTKYKNVLKNLDK